MTEAQLVTEISHNNSSSKRLRIVVLASGLGPLLQSILELLDAEKVQTVTVGSDRDCPALERVQNLNIPIFRVPFDVEAKEDREGWDIHVLEAVGSFSPDIVVSAGFTHILGPSFVGAYSNRIINTHLALLPLFPRARAVPDALDYRVKVTGTTVHIVDNGVDTGPILAQQSVTVESDDTVETLHEQIKVVERQLLVDVLYSIADYGIERDGREAYLK